MENMDIGRLIAARPRGIGPMQLVLWIVRHPGFDDCVST